MCLLCCYHYRKVFWNRQDLLSTKNTMYILNKVINLVIQSTNKMKESLLGCGYFSAIYQTPIIHKAGYKWNIHKKQQQFTMIIIINNSSVSFEPRTLGHLSMQQLILLWLSNIHVHQINIQNSEQTSISTFKWNGNARGKEKEKIKFAISKQWPSEME